jgi:hypothetical protein
MIFNDPQTLTILISIFFAVAAASAAFAVAALTIGVRQRRPLPTGGPAVAPVRQLRPAPARHAA